MFSLHIAKDMATEEAFPDLKDIFCDIFSMNGKSQFSE